MRLLHTSDWHLGRPLYGQKRYTVYAAFLDWLLHTLQQERIDVCIVAGDIFDTTSPSNHAQTLYYGFLARVAQTGCQHVVIVAGNHDSPTFLNAPQPLLKALNVHVVSQAAEDLQQQVLLLRDAAQQPLCVVCAIPYLRDRDVRQAQAGESLDDKNTLLLQGITQHYRTMHSLAAAQRQQLQAAIPLIATGHLFTAGGHTLADDGVRDLYVGNLAHVDAGIFDGFDYVALGHLHVPQVVAQRNHIRYSGSPIAIGFGEAKQQKQVLVVDFAGATPTVHSVPVPALQNLQRLQGSWQQIQNALIALKAAGNEAWVELLVDSHEPADTIRQELNALVADSPVRVLRIKLAQRPTAVLTASAQRHTLDDLSELEVFEQRLQTSGIPAEEWPDLLHTYQEVLHAIADDDPHAEVKVPA